MKRSKVYNTDCIFYIDCRKNRKYILYTQKAASVGFFFIYMYIIT